MWLFTRSPDAKAAINDSSPASTVAQMTRARVAAFSPGLILLAPCTPSIYHVEKERENDGTKKKQNEVKREKKKPKRKHGKTYFFKWYHCQCASIS